MQIKLRPAIPADLNYIVSSWLKNYFIYGDWGTKPDKHSYYQNQEIIIKRLLQSSQVTIATTDEDESQIIGYIVHEKACLHFCYVRHLFRHLGVSKRLMAGVPVSTYSHFTSDARYINKGLVYDPFKAH